MSEKAITCGRAVASDGPPATTGEGATRELAQRLSGTLEVLLLWHPEGDWVELSLRDLAVGADYRVEVAPGSALDAFYHPYAYVAGSDSCLIDEDGWTSDDG